MPYGFEVVILLRALNLCFSLQSLLIPHSEIQDAKESWVGLILCVFYTSVVGTQLYILHMSSRHTVSALLQQRDAIQRCGENAERETREEIEENRRKLGRQK